MKIEHTGLYRTRDGKKVHVLYTDGMNGTYKEFPIVGYLWDEDDEAGIEKSKSQRLRSWTQDGCRYKTQDHGDDIVGPWEEGSSKMEYKVGQKFKHRRSGRIATVVHVHNEYCLVSYDDGCADLFTAVDMGILFEPYREPLKTVTEVWVKPRDPKHAVGGLVYRMGIDEWSFDKLGNCTTKVRITVEEIEDNS